MLRGLARLLGFCGHEWEWSHVLFEFAGTVYQRAMCARCGKLRQRQMGLYWATRQVGSDTRLIALKRLNIRSSAEST